MKDQRKGVGYAIITAASWGLLAIALKVSLDDLDPKSVVWFRFFVAFVLLFSYKLFFDRKALKIFKTPSPKLFLISIFLGLNYLGFISGINHTSPTNAQIFIQLGPVIFALAGFFIFKEKLNLYQVLGLVLVIVGFSLFYSEQLSLLFGSKSQYNKGVLYVIGGAVSWSLFAITQKGLVKKYPTSEINMFIYGFCSLLFLPLVEFSKVPELDFVSWSILIFLGVNTLVAYGFLALAIKYADANKVSTVIILNPIITIVIMYILDLANVTWITPENFSWLTLLGAATLLGGAFLVLGYRSK